jgi:hypothetical protein
VTEVTKEPSEDATIRTNNPKTVIKICKSGIPSDPEILARSLVKFIPKSLQGTGLGSEPKRIEGAVETWNSKMRIEITTLFLAIFLATFLRLLTDLLKDRS